MQAEIEQLFDTKPASYEGRHFELFADFKNALNEGRVRAAEPDSSTRTGWRVNTWVKKGILIGFRIGGIIDMQSINPTPQQHVTVTQGIGSYGKSLTNFQATGSLSNKLGYAFASGVTGTFGQIPARFWQ